MQDLNCRVGYLIEPTLGAKDIADVRGHYNTIQKLQTLPGDTDSDYDVYTAGRDGGFCLWRWCDNSAITGLPGLTLKSRNTGHIDWVSDFLLMPGANAALTASHDRQVLLWPLELDRKAEATTVGLHLDYVKCLSYAVGGQLAYSAGLEGILHTYDVASDCKLVAKGHFVRGIACMQSNVQGNLLFTGSADGIIRVFDTRRPLVDSCVAECLQAKGHSDIVRTLSLNERGNTLMSGSSDCTARLWDLRATMDTFVASSVYPDSVWCLSHRERVVVVGCKDGSVYQTDETLANSSVQLEANLGSGVTSIAFSPCGQSVWAASSKNSDFVKLSLTTKDCYNVKGVPSFVKYELLNDKRHAVLLDSDGQVSMWDILRIKQVRSFGYNTKSGKTTTFSEAVERHSIQEWVSSWCSLDLTLGALSVVLDERRANDSFVYYDTVGFLPELLKARYGEHRVNVGAWVLCNIMRNSLAEKYAANQVAAVGCKESDLSIINGFPFLEWPAELPIWTTAENGAENACGPRLLFRKLLGEFPCSSNSHIAWPEWALNIVTGNAAAPVNNEQHKLAFMLVSALPSSDQSTTVNKKDSGLLDSKLPDLPVNQSQLLTNRMLRVRKILLHVVSKLQISCPQVTAAVYQQWTDSEAKDVDSNGNVSLAPEDFMELTCNNAALHPSTTLATIRNLIWKPEQNPAYLKYQGLLLQYRLKPHVKYRPLQQSNAALNSSVFSKRSGVNSLSASVLNSIGTAGTTLGASQLNAFPLTSTSSASNHTYHGTIVLLDQFKLNSVQSETL